jgi:hypothetical protein
MSQSLEFLYSQESSNLVTAIRTYLLNDRISRRTRCHTIKLLS